MRVGNGAGREGVGPVTAGRPVANTPVRFRLAVAADASAVAALHAESWRSAYRGLMADAYLDGPVHADRQEVWQARLGGGPLPEQVTVLAESDGEGVLGFCCILGGHDPVWGSLVDNLHVRPGATRRRLGRDLLGEAAARLAPSHADRPVHLTVLNGNARAIAAYEAWGGKLVGRLAKREPDGSVLPIRRYAWPSAAALMAALQATA